MPNTPPKRTLTILTGASKGLGLAMATQLLAPGHTLLCISRSRSDALQAQAFSCGADLVQWTEDLAEGAAVSQRLSRWLLGQQGADFSAANLINNAGVIPRIAALGHIDAGDIAHALRVGLEAPVQLTAGFLQSTQNWLCDRRVLNISSGLGRRAMASQAPYCAAKAGMDHFTRCVALEEALKTNGAKVCALAPGVIDTGMQEKLRSANPADFPDLDRFAQLQSSGQLSGAGEAAQRVLAFLARPDFGSNPVADVRG